MSIVAHVTSGGIGRFGHGNTLSAGSVVAEESMGFVSLQESSCALLVLGLATACAAPTAGARTIYSVNFDNTTTSGFLNGAAPDVADNSGGEIGTSTPVWFSGSGTTPISGTNANDISANGSVNTNNPNLSTAAYLPFTPAAGHVYQLQARLNDTSTLGNGRWLAVGFTQNTTTPTTGGARWVDASGPGAVAWMLHRQQGYSATSFDQTFLGPGTANPTPGSNANVTDPVGSLPSPVDVRITLDTTTPLWGVTWAMKNDANPGDPFTVVRTDAFATNPTIGEVGLFALNATQGQFSNFSLSDVTPVPEPAAATALALTGIAALGARRRQRRAATHEAI
jgi:MYXO-CTERM domain-containing protein